MSDSRPARFLNVRVHRLEPAPGLSALCVGYERGEWRTSQFADHVMEWLPEFALKKSEIAHISSADVVSLMRRAAKLVYESEKFKSRGEFGELFLHAAIRQVFNSQPAISKLVYKTSRNETVKGFDAVHVVEGPDGLELWLGEAKFYNDSSRAIRDVVSELKKHTETDYLRDEFLLIKGKIEPDWNHAAEFEAMIHENRSLDEVFKRACIAVLLTYDSECLARHTNADSAYAGEFAAEVESVYEEFIKQPLPRDFTVHLILIPLNTKLALLTELDRKLKAWQNI